MDSNFCETTHDAACNNMLTCLSSHSINVYKYPIVAGNLCPYHQNNLIHIVIIRMGAIFLLQMENLYMSGYFPSSIPTLYMLVYILVLTVQVVLHEVTLHTSIVMSWSTIIIIKILILLLVRPSSLLVLL